jgi:hypothetical protein
LILEINYLTYQQINKTKWDSCIDNADNGLIYGYTFYLDSMSKNWEALVLNDYEAVMPLTWNKKFGIHYLYQPPFTACLGVFGKGLTAETVNSFLNTIPPRYKYWDIYFNHGNFFKLGDFKLYERMNYVLNLGSNYEELYKAYRENIKRNIKKAEQLHLQISKNISISDVIALAKEQAGGFSETSETDFNNFENLYHLLYQKEKATTYAVYTKDKQLIASAVFLFSHSRTYYIMVGNHPDGKTLGASHALINGFIKDHAGEDLLLDFEGSDISSLAFFYSSFGATEEKYSAVKLNRLPAPIKWLKK